MRVLFLAFPEHLAGEFRFGLLEQEELFLAEDLGELVEVLGLNLSLSHSGVGECRCGGLIVLVAGVLLFLHLSRSICS